MLHDWNRKEVCMWFWSVGKTEGTTEPLGVGGTVVEWILNLVGGYGLDSSGTG
jgi:hypothetical protein